MKWIFMLWFQLYYDVNITVMYFGDVCYRCSPFGAVSVGHVTGLVMRHDRGEGLGVSNERSLVVDSV